MHCEDTPGRPESASSAPAASRPGALDSRNMAVRRGDEVRGILAVFDREGPGGRLFALDVAARTDLGGRAVYSLLARLERTGWLESDWDQRVEGEHFRRRYYFMTALGQDRVGDYLNPRAPRATEPERRDSSSSRVAG